MIRLHYANRLESLIAPLADAIAAQQRERPLERVTIVVPSRVIEHFLKHRVAETIGIAANLDFPFLRKFFAEVIKKADPKLRILEVEELEVILFESLRTLLSGDSGDFHAPRGYVEMGPATAEERELRTFRLAGQMARLFRDYSIARRSMLQKWTRADDLDGGQSSETEIWQRKLWISIFNASGYLRNQWKDDPEFEWLLLPDAFEAVSASKLKAALPAQVHVFGLAYAGPAYIKVFSQIGNLVDLSLYALNPCLEFWEDVQHLSRIDREAWAHHHSRVGSELEQSPDPFLLDAAGDTPALRLWARPGREYIRMLNELTDCDFEAHFTHRNLSADSSLLGVLQEDILNREPERPPHETDSPRDEGSIRFFACPNIAREAEIAANEIWSILERDQRGRDAMRFHQIAVIVPDALYQNYLPHLESAFSRLHQLPINIVSRGSGGESPVREAISLLLRLPLGRFLRDEMLHLMNHPAIRGEDSELETEQASRWCEHLGIFFGADADDLADSYIPRDAYHWDQGIRRMALGVFMGTERDQEAQFYRAPESIEYLPYETAQDEIPAVAAFIRNARRLLFDANEIRSRKLTLPQWAKLLSRLIVTNINVDNPDEERIRQQCIEAIDSISSPEIRSAPVPYRIAHELVSSRLSDLQPQLSQFTEHGIAIGPLSALRAIPFRAIFLLGLNEAQFPERERRDPTDLRHARRKTGDVSPTERDRYLFLETLLAARERICLSYIGRDAKTGDRLAPSSVVRELQYALRGYMSSHSIAQLTIEHPLSRYDSDYFPDVRGQDLPSHRNLTSYDAEAHRGATMAALRNDLARHCEGIPLPGRDEPIYQQLQKGAHDLMRPALRLLEMPRARATEIGTASEISLPISALRKFLECPLQGAAQYALGISEDGADELAQWEDEPIAQSILERTNLLREVFWKTRGNRELLAIEYAKSFRISRLSGEAPAGPFEQAAQQNDLREMGQWIELAERAGCLNLERWQEIRMGRGDELAKSDRIVSELSIPVRNVFGGDEQIRVVKIHGSLGFFSPVGDAALRLVLRKESKAKDFLGPFVSAILLAAAGELDERQFSAIVAGAGKGKSWIKIQGLHCPTSEQARAYLSDLLTDLLFDKNHYFLPIEAVEKVQREIDEEGTEDLEDIVNVVRDNEFSNCSSDYGPIRDARRFEPPTADHLKLILDRRFRLIRSIFSKEKS